MQAVQKYLNYRKLFSFIALSFSFSFSTKAAPLLFSGDDCETSIRLGSPELEIIREQVLLLRSQQKAAKSEIESRSFEAALFSEIRVWRLWHDAEYREIERIDAHLKSLASAVEVELSRSLKHHGVINFSAMAALQTSVTGQKNFLDLMREKRALRNAGIEFLRNTVFQIVLRDSSLPEDIVRSLVSGTKHIYSESLEKFEKIRIEIHAEAQLRNRGYLSHFPKEVVAGFIRKEHAVYMDTLAAYGRLLSQFMRPRIREKINLVIETIEFDRERF